MSGARARVAALGAVYSDPAALRALQEERFAAQLDRLRTRHPRYREMLQGAEVASLDDFARIAPTGKSDLASDPEAYRLDAADPSDILWDIAYTSGSTSAPTPIFQTARDFRAILTAQLHMAAIRGMSADDRIANLFPLTTQPHGAWTRANHAAAALGCELVVGLGGAAADDYPVTRRTTEIVRMLERTQPTVLWGVPSYLARILEAARSADVPLTGIRMFAASGEACPPALQAQLTQLAAEVGSPDAVVSNSFGASELQCGLVECVPGTGFHNPAPDQFFFETIDDDGAPTSDGEPGRLALTHLDRRGTAFLRYVLGDVVEYTIEPCPECGWAGGRVVAHHRREGSMVKVRGNLFDVTVLGAAVGAVDGVREHQAVVRTASDGMDELVLRVVETADGALDADAVQRAVRAAIRVTPRVERVALFDIHGATGSLKPRRFVDERSS
ncbi:phenylacetate--CoA ligase family protein [Microbacterium sp. 179-I 3D3 NHS]|uniref:phenylacetate--CoA ligase family protein n=1 Tax=Microbacterium sp. 179-I 3D3 NHS TaxID=3142382 RepID=UPI0039A203C6